MLLLETQRYTPPNWGLRLIQELTNKKSEPEAWRYSRSSAKMPPDRRNWFY